MIPEQLEQLNCQIMLGNTYHLGNRPVQQSRNRKTFLTTYILTAPFPNNRALICWKAVVDCTTLWAGQEIC